MTNELGDWMCGSCHHHNFRKRESCQKCRSHKYGMGSGTTGLVAMAGDWYCDVIHCGAHNYANRASCHQCGEYKVDNNYGLDPRIYSCGDGIGVPGWKSGDWICTRAGCGAHNYASRMECYKCATSKHSS